MADEASGATAEQAGEAAPAAAPANGKAKGASKGKAPVEKAPDEPAKTATEDDLLAAYAAAEEKIAAAKRAVAEAEAGAEEAKKALGAFLIPPGGRRGDRFQFWTGAGETRRCLEVIVGKDGAFSIAPFRGRPAA